MFIKHKIKYLLRQFDQNVRRFIRYITGATSNIGKVIDTYHWIRFRFWDRYDKVNMKSLDPGYYEPDTRILHSSFELVRQFMEGNKPYRDIEMRDGKNAEAYDVIFDLYVWWKWERKREWEIYEKYSSWVHNQRPEREYETIKEDGERRLLKRERKGSDFEENRYNALRDELFRLEDKLHQKDEKQLKRLAEVRRHLWT